MAGKVAKGAIGRFLKYPALEGGLRLSFSDAQEENPLAGFWDRQRVAPTKAADQFVGAGDLGAADHEREASMWRNQASGDGKGGFKMLDGAEGDDVGLRRRSF